MCIVDGQVENISKTNIFIGNLDQDHQFTVYSNNINVQNVPITGRRPVGILPTRNVAMILPFPKGNSSDGDIKIYDMSECDNIFNTLKECFPYKDVFSNDSYGFGNIPIFKSGSYDVSIVSNLDNFDNLQFNKFNISNGVKHLLKRDYSNDFGFIVCVIRNGAKFHPIAYSHKIKSDNNLFIPTKHYHNGSENNADWDHEIYVMGCNIDYVHQKGIKVRKSNISDKLENLPFKLIHNPNLTNISINYDYIHNNDITVIQ